MLFLCVVRLAVLSDVSGNPVVPSSVVPSNEVSSCTLAASCNGSESTGNQYANTTDVCYSDPDFASNRFATSGVLLAQNKNYPVLPLSL